MCAFCVRFVHFADWTRHLHSVVCIVTLQSAFPSGFIMQKAEYGTGPPAEFCINVPPKNADCTQNADSANTDTVPYWSYLSGSDRKAIGRFRQTGGAGIHRITCPGFPDSRWVHHVRANGQGYQH